MISPFLARYMNIIILVSWTEILGMVLDTTWNFDEHLKNIYKTTNKNIRLVRKLQQLLPRASLVSVLKSFFVPHVDYSDLICDHEYDAWYLSLAKTEKQCNINNN